VGYATITAPQDGTIGARSLRVGQYVQAGTQLMAVVPLRAVYVVANYKETQLTDVRPGQPVTIEVDTFPDHAVRGVVESIAPASGQQFARCRRTTRPATSPRSCSASRSRSCSAATANPA
jgi:membrane fusion protein, multidrug efflux system